MVPQRRNVDGQGKRPTPGQPARVNNPQNRPILRCVAPRRSGSCSRRFRALSRLSPNRRFARSRRAESLLRPERRSTEPPLKRSGPALRSAGSAFDHTGNRMPLGRHPNASGRPRVSTRAGSSPQFGFVLALRSTGTKERTISESVRGSS